MIMVQKKNHETAVVLTRNNDAGLTLCDAFTSHQDVMRMNIHVHCCQWGGFLAPLGRFSDVVHEKYSLRAGPFLDWQ